MVINQSCNYKESLYFISDVKRHYDSIMLSFSVYGGNIKPREDIRKLKKEIYSLGFETWKKDKLWEYITNDIEYTELWKFV